DCVEVLITPDGYGCQLIVLVYGPEELRAPDERKGIRYRLGTLFAEALRRWIDEPRCRDTATTRGDNSRRRGRRHRQWSAFDVVRRRHTTVAPRSDTFRRNTRPPKQRL